MGIQSYELFYPMLAMFCWTWLVMARNIQVRVRAVTSGRLPNRYFELFRGAEPEAELLKTGNHLRNLMEFPPLFYVISVIAMFSGRSDPLFVALAWLYVAARVAHSVVHLTINKVPLRFVCYAVSNIVLAIMWLRFALRVA